MLIKDTSLFLAVSDFFADENFRDSAYLMATEILVCEMHGRDDKISSCNHDMDLVIGKALALIGPYWLGDWVVSRRG